MEKLIITVSTDKADKKATLLIEMDEEKNHLAINWDYPSKEQASIDAKEMYMALTCNIWKMLEESLKDNPS
jgi:hypothetical protein